MNYSSETGGRCCIMRIAVTLYVQSSDGSIFLREMSS